MKQGRKLFRSEKELLKKQHLNPEEYSFLGECLDSDGRPGSYFRIQSKKTGTIKVICRFSGKK